jgi:hypothetical protein
MTGASAQRGAGLGMTARSGIYWHERRSRPPEAVERLRAEGKGPASSPSDSPSRQLTGGSIARAAGWLARQHGAQSAGAGGGLIRPSRWRRGASRWPASSGEGVPAGGRSCSTLAGEVVLDDAPQRISGFCFGFAPFLCRIAAVRHLPQNALRQRSSLLWRELSYRPYREALLRHHAPRANSVAHDVGLRAARPDAHTEPRPRSRLGRGS